MNKQLSVLAAGLMLGIALPLGAVPAMAQDSQAVRDALRNAQSGAEKRAVEDLINRLRGTPAQAAPAAGTAPAAAPATTAAPAPATAPAGSG